MTIGSTQSTGYCRPQPKLVSIYTGSGIVFGSPISSKPKDDTLKTREVYRASCS
jgi:hypothetical protein